MFNALKNKITNFASYLLGLDEQLANAKTDKERNKILTQIVEVQKEQIEELKRQIKELEAKQREDSELNQILIEAKNNAERLDVHIQQLLKK